MAKQLLSDNFAMALAAAGFLEDVSNVRRVVIDLQAGHVPVIHVERFGDTELLDVIAATAQGVTVERVGAPSN